MELAQTSDSSSGIRERDQRRFEMSIKLTFPTSQSSTLPAEFPRRSTRPPLGQLLPASTVLIRTLTDGSYTLRAPSSVSQHGARRMTSVVEQTSVSATVVASRRDAFMPQIRVIYRDRTGAARPVHTVHPSRLSSL